MSSDMLSWIRGYENRRQKEARESYQNFQSSKYDFQNIPSPQLKRIFIPELGMTIGSSISALKASWQKYRLAKKDIKNTGNGVATNLSCTEVTCVWGIRRVI